MLQAIKNFFKSTEEQQLLAIVAENTDNAVIITDAGGKVLWVNEGFTIISGYTLEEVKGKKPGHILQGPDTDPQTVQRIREAINNKQSFKERILNYHKNGKPYWIQIHVTPVFNDKQQLTHFIAFELDITNEMEYQKEAENLLIDQMQLNYELQQREEELKQYNEEIHATQEKLQETVYSLDAFKEAINTNLGYMEIGLDKTILHVNDRLARILGYEPQELIGTSHRNFVGSLNTDEKYEEDWKKILTLGKVEGEFRRLTKNNEIKWVYAAYFVVKNFKTGEPYKIIKIATDITEQVQQRNELQFQHQKLLESQEELKMAQEELIATNEELKNQSQQLEQSLQELKNSQQQLRLLSLVASNTDNAVIITNANREIEWVNPSFTRISGYTLEEVKGKIPGRILQGPDTDPNTVQRIREKLAHKVSFQEEILNYAKDGRPYWLSLSITPILNELGEVEKFIAIEMDITEKKEKERILQERNKEIEESLNYAKRIQNALLPDENLLKKHFKNHIIYAKQKAEVGGDFYWFRQLTETQFYVGVSDCTGHGAAGAMLATFFQQFITSIAFRYAELPFPEKLQKLHKHIVNLQTKQNFQEAFETTILSLQNDEIQLFTTSSQPIIIQKTSGLVDVLKSSNYLGKNPLLPDEREFELFTFKKKHLHRIFLMTDGILDQFGGPDNKKFGIQRLKSIVSSNPESSIREITKEFLYALKVWQGTHEQTDDQTLLILEL